eukprot:4776617-Amphidinium_carterae.1
MHCSPPVGPLALFRASAKWPSNIQDRPIGRDELHIAFWPECRDCKDIVMASACSCATLSLSLSLSGRLGAEWWT